MSITTNPNDECLIVGQKEEGQNECYLVLSDEERAKGFVRPYRDTYVHKTWEQLLQWVELFLRLMQEIKIHGATFCRLQ